MLFKCKNQKNSYALKYFIPIKKLIYNLLKFYFWISNNIPGEHDNGASDVESDVEIAIFGVNCLRNEVLISPFANIVVLT